MHRLGVALVGGRKIERACLGKVFLHANAFFVEAAKTELRRRQSLLCRKLKPTCRLLLIRRNTAALRKSHRDFEFRRGIAGDCRCAQRRATDRVR